MPTATLAICTCETIGRPKESKYEGKPPYRPVLFKLADGTQKWKSYNEDAPELTWLKKGAQYQCTLTGDDFTIIEPTQDGPPAATSAPQAAPTQPTGPTLTDDQKRQIAAYICDLAPLYAYCYQQSKAQLEPHGAPDGAIQAGASSLFIAAQRKFNLA